MTKITEAEQFFQEYQKVLQSCLNYAWYLSGDKSKAEDLCSEVLVNTLSAIKERTLVINNHKAWLIRSIRNLYLTNQAKENKQALIDLDKVISEDEDYDLSLDYKNVMHKINTKLEPPIYKEILILKYKLDLANSEIAEILNITEANVRQIQKRALEKLKLLCRK